MWRDCWIVLLSRPARALWIEIQAVCTYMGWKHSRGPRGPCGLEIGQSIEALYGRGPRGPCGLKSMMNPLTIPHVSSRPARALWIEIDCIWRQLFPRQVEAREGLVD